MLGLIIFFNIISIAYTNLLLHKSRSCFQGLTRLISIIEEMSQKKNKENDVMSEKTRGLLVVLVFKRIL